ncbi:MAG: hypothetical protein II951_01705 [Bacteroidales bacterium]|nr:hypothetical protein [Bacteroidales bacterium]
MRLIKSFKDVVNFGVCENKPLIVYSDYFLLGESTHTKRIDDYVYTENDVLLIYKRPESISEVYKNGRFESLIAKISIPRHLGNNIWIEHENHEDGHVDVRFVECGEEYMFSLIASKGIHWPKYDKNNSILLFSEPNESYVLAYTKTGERLWEYNEEDSDLKINGRCIPVVDDVVVIISLYGARPKKIQGFNIRTGKRLWIIQSEARHEPDTFFLGEDKMLYGCRGYVVRPGIGITKLNPFTGELNVSLINEDEEFDFMPWNVTMNGRQLYFVDNRRGNEIGVIDVDKKELVERVPLNIKKKVTIGAPVVTDDKVYVFIRDLEELRVFEK